MDSISLCHSSQPAQLQSSNPLYTTLDYKYMDPIFRPFPPKPRLRPTFTVYCSKEASEDMELLHSLIQKRREEDLRELVDSLIQKLIKEAILEDEDGTGEVGNKISSRLFPLEAPNINYYKDCTFRDCRFDQHRGPEIQSRPTTEAGSGGDGSKGRFPPSGGSRGGGGKDDDDGDIYDERFPQYKNVAERMWAEAAKRTGNLGSIFRWGLFLASCSILGNPTLALLAAQPLLSTVGIATQVVIDSCFSTFAKLLKKGMEFSARLFAEGFLLGVTVFIAVGRFLATHMGLMPSAASGGFFGHVQRGYSPLRSRITKRPERENPVSSVVKSALLWGVFLPLSQIPVIRFLLDWQK